MEQAAIPGYDEDQKLMELIGEHHLRRAVECRCTSVSARGDMKHFLSPATVDLVCRDEAAYQNQVVQNFLSGSSVGPGLHWTFCYTLN